MTHVTLSQAIEMVAIAIVTMSLIHKWKEIRLSIRWMFLNRSPNRKILKEAVTAIYLGGGTRTYTGALWEIVGIIDPEMRSLLADDERAAFRLVNPESEEDE